MLFFYKCYGGVSTQNAREKRVYMIDHINSAKKSTVVLSASKNRLMNAICIYCCCCEVATGVAQLVGGFGALGASPNLNVLFIAITRETTINSSTNHTQCVDYVLPEYIPPAKNACVPFDVAAKPDLKSSKQQRVVKSTKQVNPQYSIE
jgi:hypothetical protein